MIIIGLGANLPWLGRSPVDNVTLAIAAVARLGSFYKQSSLYKSRAWPDPSDPPYVNAVMALSDTDIAPRQFLEALHAIEASFGRHRSESQRYAPRSLDLDLLAFHDTTCKPAKPGAFALPHPAIQDRSFVLMPIAEILPDWRHPRTGLNCDEMLKTVDREGTEILDGIIKPW
mgnify:CR=1 FL=1